MHLSVRSLNECSGCFCTLGINVRQFLPSLSRGTQFDMFGKAQCQLCLLAALTSLPVLSVAGLVVQACNEARQAGDEIKAHLGLKMNERPPGD